MTIKKLPNKLNNKQKILTTYVISKGFIYILYPYFIYEAVNKQKKIKT